MADTAKTDMTLLSELRGLIEQARQQVAQTANSTLTMLYWRMGERIRREVLNEQRASYGEEILPTLSAKLVREFGKGFAEKSLRRRVQFAEVFPDEQIVVSLVRQFRYRKSSLYKHPSVPAYRRRARGLRPAPRSESRPFGFDP